MPQKLALLGGKPLRTKPFRSWPVFDSKEEKRLLGALHSGNWGRLDGTEVAEFEEDFGAMHGCRHAIAVVNGTVSLKIALLAAGIEADDEVIVPAYTFFSTASAVVEANAIPVFADIELDTFNLEPKSVESLITPRTRALIAVHFAGQPAAMKQLMALAKMHDLVVIEDAAHAHAAKYRSRPAGSLGHMASFSFQSSKNLTSGEGGIITTNDRRLAEACRSIHNCGRVPDGMWYEHHRISGNYRLSEFQGAILNCQLARLETQTETRHQNGQYLSAKLSLFPGIYPQKRSRECTRHSFHLFMFRLHGTEFGASRDAVARALESEGIPCSTGYRFSLPQQPMFLNKAFGPYLSTSSRGLDYRQSRCPNSDLICREQGFWLGQELMLGSQRDMDDIVQAFEKVYENRGLLHDWDRHGTKEAL
jgi:dTDP-4-amino-4,6-dideoxygalactose transaminase